MTSSEKTSWYVPLIIIGLLVLSFGGLYYLSEVMSIQETKVRKEFDYSGRPVQQMVRPGQVILSLNEKKLLEKHGLTYRGIENKKIMLDLYLLEMDPDQAYRKQIPKKIAKKEMVLGGKKYRMLSVNRNSLILKKIETQ